MLDVRVLGALSASVDGRPIQLPADARARELLAWLVMAPGPHPRSALAGRLRPDVGEDSARQTLRNAVYELRRALGPAGRDAIEAGRERIGLAGGAVRCDLWELRRRLAAGDLAGALEQGAAGELLAGMDADWVLRARDEHVRALAGATDALVAEAEQAGDLRAAIGWVRRRLELEPLAEDAHRELIRLLARAGDRPAALSAATALGERLRRELGVPLSPQTRALVEDVRRGRVAPARPAAPAPAAHALPAPLARTGRPEGREPELAKLLAAWRDAAGGGLRLALVAGEPGIGKTTLAGELARRVHSGGGAAVLYGRSDEQALVPYQPWVEALERLLDGMPPDDASHWLALHDGALARLLPARSPGMAAAQGPRERYLAFEAVRTVLEGTAERCPVLLALDDVHWADPDSLALLRHVVRTAADARALILLCARDAELTGAVADAVGDLRRERPLADVALAGLDEDAVAALLAGSGATGGEEAAGRYLRRTGGNPFFLTELLRDEEERGRHARFPPPAIRDVIARRLGRLSERARDTLAVAALLGLEFALDDLAGAAPAEPVELLEGLDEGTAAGLVVPAGAAGRYAFAHALLGETIASGLGGARRAQLHLRVAEQLARRPGAQAGEVAGHLRAAGPLVPAERRVAWELRAAREALGALAYADAAARYEAALAHLETDRTEPLLALGDALDRAGERRRARAAFAEAAELARADGDAEALARAALGHGGLAVVIAAPDPDTTRLLEDALAAAGEADAATGARLRARLAVELHYPDPARADELSRRAVADARAAADHAALAAALNARRVSVWDPAHVEERLQLAGEMVEVAEAAGATEAALQGRAWRIVDLWELGRLDDVAREVAAYEVLSEPAVAHYRWYVPLWRAGLAILQGRWDEVAGFGAAARRLGRQADDPNAEVFAGIQRWMALDGQGRTGEIDRDFIRRRAAASAVPGAWLSWIVHIDARTGRPEDAAATLRELVRAGDWPAMDVNWHAACELADAAAVVADRDAAAALHERLAPYADLFPVVARGVASYGCAEGYVGRLAATLGRLDEAEARLRRAVERNERAGARPSHATALLHLGEVLAERGEPDRARDALEEALARARELAMPALAEEAEAALRGLQAGRVLPGHRGRTTP